MPTSKSAARWRGWGIGILKIALTLIAFSIIGYTVGFSKAWKHVAEQSWWLLLVGAVFMLVQIGCGALRWHFVLMRLGAGINLLTTSRLFYIAVFFNNAMASFGGDVMRGWLAMRTQVNTEVAIHSVILDRVATLAGMAVLVLLTAPLFIARVGGGWFGYTPAIVAFVGLVGIVVVAQLDRLPFYTIKGVRILVLFRSMAASTRKIFLQPGSVATVLALGATAQLAMSVAAYVIAMSLHIALTPVDCLVLMQPVALLAALPISIGGWGVRETAMIGLLGFVGIPTSAALILSVQLGILAAVVSVPGGLFMLRQRASAPAQEGVRP